MQMEQSERGEILIEHRHDTAMVGATLDQHDLCTAFGKVERSLDTRNAAADYQHGVTHGDLPAGLQ